MDASDTTNRRKNRTLFANRVIQQTTFDKGWKNRIILEEGVHTGAGAMTYAPNFYSASDGAVETNTSELDALIDSVPNKFPNPPTNVSAALVSGNVLVAFTAPRYQGETPVTSYTVISNPGGVRVTGTASPITVTGLTPGVTYTFTVIARNASGNSEPSEPSNAVDTATVPDAPTAVSGAGGNGFVDVSFTAPAFDGGLPIIDYIVTAYDGSTVITTAAGSASPITVSGLTNGTAYTFTVKARNTVGYGAESAASAAVTPATIPDAPTSVAAVAGSGQATISFSIPFNGGAAILDYTFTAYVSGSPVGTLTGSGSPTTWTGLTNGTTYTFTVKARNTLGYSSESAPSAPITLATVPGIPTNFAVVPGAGSMKLYFTAPADDGGSAITNYMYSTNNGASFTSAGTTSSPISVSGLVAGTSYNFKLKAVNVIGAGDPTSALAAAALAAFDPVNIAGMNTWFDPQVPASITSAGSQVTAAADQSGSGNNFAASATGIITYDFPSGINGRPSFNFTTSAPTTSTYLYKDNVNLAPTNELTLFMVVYQTGKGSPGNCELFFTRNNYQYFDLFNNTYSTGVLSINVGNAIQQSTDVNIFSPLTPAVISVVVTTSTVTIYVNGTVTSVNASARGGLSLNDATLDWAISGGAYRGYIGDVATYGAVTNTLQRQAMEGYLAWKWGLQSSLPGAHPYSSAPPALALPAAPTSLAATAGDASASIAFTAESNGGSAITNYQYSTDNGATFTAFSPAQTSSPVTISGLSNGTTYNVKLKAVTDFGVGVASESVSVTPESTETIVQFKTTGTTTWVAPAGVSTINYLVVGGGGGGGGSYDGGAGGGGAGGLVLTGSRSVTPGQSYTVVVGAGGTGGIGIGNGGGDGLATAGGNSSFDTITADGGGLGFGSLDNRTGTGGAQGDASTLTAPVGGKGGRTPQNGFGSGGGGGMGSAGATAVSATNASGGSGIVSNITGSSVTYGAGGSGGRLQINANGSSATANTGNGGNGSGSSFSDGSTGGDGGSGIVVISY